LNDENLQSDRNIDKTLHNSYTSFFMLIYGNMVEKSAYYETLVSAKAGIPEQLLGSLCMWHWVPLSSAHAMGKSG
jgi:hypothetical protein